MAAGGGAASETVLERWVEQPAQKPLDHCQGVFLEGRIHLIAIFADERLESTDLLKVEGPSAVLADRFQKVTPLLIHGHVESRRLGLIRVAQPRGDPPSSHPPHHSIDDHVEHEGHEQAPHDPKHQNIRLHNFPVNRREIVKDRMAEGK